MWLNMKIVVLIDSFSFDRFHLIFNFSLLHSLSRNNDLVLYYASTSLINNLKKLSVSKNIEEFGNVKYIPLYVPNSNSSVGYLYKYIYGALVNIYISIKHRKNILYYPILNPILFNVLNLISQKFKTSINVICHGELELLIKDEPCYKPSFLYKKEIVRVFSKMNLSKYLFFYVLGDSIKNNLIKEGYYKSNVKVIFHPYIFDVNDKYSMLSLPITAGTIGVMSEEKGYSNYIRFVKMFENEINSNQIVFKHIGGITSNKICKSIDCKRVGLLSLSDTEFNIEITSLDIALFFYPENSYKLTASGAVFDAINHMKILIVLENDYFIYLFNKCGRLGYLCTNIDQMYVCLKNVINCDNSTKDDFSLFYKNILKARELFSYRNLDL